MIQTTNVFTYSNVNIFQMHDSGAYWYEIEEGRDIKYFDNLESAKNYIEGCK